MKVVEYWYGTIKNNRYDGGVSVAAATSASGIATGGTTVVRFAAAALALMEAAHDHVEAAHAQLVVVTTQIERSFSDNGRQPMAKESYPYKIM